jgi:hypothetical protein
MDYKIILGYLAVIVGFLGYIPYLRDIFRNKTKPHIFSWFLWGLIETIILAIQINQHAGAGAWVTGFTAFICFLIAGLSFKKGIKEFLRLDWVLLFASLFSLLLWWFTNNPLTATILLILTDAAAFSITFRKTYKYPYTETVIEYVFAALKSLVGIFALQTYNLNTWLFFAYLVIANSAFVIMTIVRRKQLEKKLDNQKV